MGTAARDSQTTNRPVVLKQRRAQPGKSGSKGTDAPGLPARRAAVALLNSILMDGGMLQDATAKTGAERAEARAMADLCLRRLGQVDKALAAFVDRPPKGPTRQILRLMATELLFAGTSPHAAVDLAVRMTRAAPGGARLAGLVNAVGRRLADQGVGLVALQDASNLNLPEPLRGWLKNDWGQSTLRDIASAHLTAPPHDLSLRTSGDTLPFAQEINGTLLPTGSIRTDGRPQVSGLPGYEAGAWWVQDAAAALPATLLPHGGHVLDLCAAPGGKTMQLAAAGAEVVAVDASAARMQRVQENLDRTGLSADLVVADVLEWRPGTQQDAILLDAPCSATGTIRRHPDLPHRLKEKAIRELVELQTRLIDRAFDWLSPGGVLVWCTCSLLKAEGEEQANAFLARHPDAEMLPITPDEIPAEFISDGCLRTRPDHWSSIGGVDGFFAQRIRHKA